MTSGDLKIPHVIERRCDGAYVATVIDTLTPEQRNEIASVMARMGWPLPAAVEPIGAHGPPPALHVAARASCRGH